MGTPVPRRQLPKGFFHGKLSIGGSSCYISKLEVQELVGVWKSRLKADLLSVYNRAVVGEGGYCIYVLTFGITAMKARTCLSGDQA